MRKIALCFLIFTITLSLVAQEAYYQESQKKLMARRAAMLDGYRQLAETIQGVKITSSTTVRDFVTEKDEIKANLDTYILRGAQVVATRYLPDGTCEVDMVVNLADVVTFLKFSQSQYDLARFRAVNFDAIQGDSIIRATGTGAQPGGMTEEQAKALKDSNAQMKEEIANLQQQLANALAFQQSLGAAQAENSQLKQELALARQENQALKNQLKDAQTIASQYDESKRRYDDIVVSLSTLRNEWQKQQGEMARLQQQFANAQHQLTNAQQQLATTQQQLANAQQQLAGMQNLRTQIGQLLVQNDQLSKANVDLTKANADLRAQLEAQKQMIAQLSKANADLTKANADLQAQLQERRQSFAQLSKANADLQAQLDAQKHTTAQLNKANADLAKANADLQAQLQGQRQLAGQLDQCQKIIHSLGLEKNRLEAQVADLQRQIKSYQQQCADLTQELSNLKLQIEGGNQGLWRDASSRDRLMARRAAILDGYRLLLETVKGIRIDSSTTVQDFVTQNDQIKASTEGFIQGAQIVSTRYLPEGICEVDVVINTKDLVEFLQRMSSQHRTSKPSDAMPGIYGYYPNAMIKATGNGALNK